MNCYHYTSDLLRFSNKMTVIKTEGMHVVSNIKNAATIPYYLSCTWTLPSTCVNFCLGFFIMSDEPGPASKILSKIQLKLERTGRKYIPESHCIFCLSKGTKTKPLYSTENGRALVNKVCTSVFYYWTASCFHNDGLLLCIDFSVCHCVIRFVKTLQLKESLFNRQRVYERMRK